MADNATVTGTTGLAVASDDISSVYYQRIKVSVGSSGNATDATTADPFPVKIGDGTDLLSIDSFGSAFTILKDASGNSVTFNANGRATAANSAPVVMASQTARSLSSSTGQSVSASSSSTGAAGDWLDGLLVTPTSTAAGIIQITDGTTGTLVTIASGSYPNLYPFWIPYPATSATSGWYINIGVNQKVTAFGNLSAT